MQTGWNTLRTLYSLRSTGCAPCTGCAEFADAERYERRAGAPRAALTRLRTRLHDTVQVPHYEQFY